MQTIKSFKSLIIALVVCSNVFSQINVYKPFPITYGNWNVSGQHYVGSPPTGSYLTYQNYEAFGDTIVGLYSYKKVTVSTSMSNPFNYGPKVFAFGYRNDVAAKKVYYLDTTGGLNKDTLWYNFNLSVGDTLKNTYSFGNLIGYNANLRRIVQSIDSVLICGTYHKQFNFSCTIGGGFQTQLIEGFGFKDLFTQTAYIDCPFEPNVVYSTYGSSCNVNAIVDLGSHHHINLYPNPTSSELKISNSLKFSNYLILNSIGEIVLTGNARDVETFNISCLVNGLYTLKIQDDDENYYQTKFIKQ